MTEAETFNWRMDGDTRVVVAIRPNGAMVESAKDRFGRGTHTREAIELSDLHVRARNAFDFIARVDRTGKYKESE